MQRSSSVSYPAPLRCAADMDGEMIYYEDYHPAACCVPKKPLSHFEEVDNPVFRRSRYREQICVVIGVGSESSY